MTFRSRSLVLLLSLASSLAAAQTVHPASPALPDRTWLKEEVGSRDAIMLRPRFRRLLRIALPQRQWFWYEHERLLTVPELAATFLAVNFGNPQMTAGRYLTITGCVPHDCTDNGLLWIDTAPGQPANTARVLFVANPLVGGGPGSHLWLFTSSKGFNWQKPDADFRAQLTRWLGNLTTGQPAPNDRQHVTLITVVRPDGQQEDLVPDELLTPQPGVTK